MIINTGNLQVTLPSDRQIAMSRRFDAPRKMVFDAYTKPELLKRWLGVFAGFDTLAGVLESILSNGTGAAAQP